MRGLASFVLALVALTGYVATAVAADEVQDAIEQLARAFSCPQRLKPDERASSDHSTYTFAGDRKTFRLKQDLVIPYGTDGTRRVISEFAADFADLEVPTAEAAAGADDEYVLFTRCRDGKRCVNQMSGTRPLMNNDGISMQVCGEHMKARVVAAFQTLIGLNTPPPSPQQAVALLARAF